jgi:chromosome segregation ATPase
MSKRSSENFLSDITTHLNKKQIIEITRDVTNKPRHEKNYNLPPRTTQYTSLPYPNFLNKEKEFQKEKDIMRARYENEIEKLKNEIFRLKDEKDELYDEKEELYEQAKDIHQRKEEYKEINKDIYTVMNLLEEDNKRLIEENVQLRTSVEEANKMINVQHIEITKLSTEYNMLFDRYLTLCDKFPEHKNMATTIRKMIEKEGIKLTSGSRDPALVGQAQVN